MNFGLGRRATIQKNRKACAMLVWNHLKKMANVMEKTIDKLTHQLSSKNLVSELKDPTIKMTEKMGLKPCPSRATF
ncbi:MAG: hypothetical protein F6K24_25645 [Okeania sp. SIO2D1]|nr:hypothetical protein [Okeania sp. SIO2D1]